MNRSFPITVSFVAFLLVCVAFFGYGTATALPPDTNRLDYIINGAWNSEPVRKQSTALTTTPIAAVDTDVPAAARVDGKVQLFSVFNPSATNRVCVGSVAWSGASTCATLCNTAASWTGQGFAATMNCTAGDVSMGSLVAPGKDRSFRYDGTRCVCVVGSAAATEFQVERVLR